jgi:hypothetical protein
VPRTLIGEDFGVAQLIVYSPEVEGIESAFVTKEAGAAVREGIVGAAVCSFFIAGAASFLGRGMAAAFDFVDVIAGAFAQVHVKMIVIIAFADFLFAKNDGVARVFQVVRFDLFVHEQGGILTERPEIIVPAIDDVGADGFVRLDILWVDLYLGAAALFEFGWTLKQLKALVVFTELRGPAVDIGPRGKAAVVIVSVKNEGEAHLLEVAQTFDGRGFFFGARERGQKHAGQNGDDRNDDEKFDQSKSARFPPRSHRVRQHFPPFGEKGKTLGRCAPRRELPQIN